MMPRRSASGQTPFVTEAVIAITTKANMLDTIRNNKDVKNGTTNSFVHIFAGERLFN